MNARAAQLGLHDTHYINPYGYGDPQHYSSPADLVKLATMAMGNPLFATIVKTQTYTVDPNLSHVRYDWMNVLIDFLQSYPGATGIKTGSNGDGSDWCMVFSAWRFNHLLIGAEMGASSQHQVFSDASNILDYGYGMVMKVKV
jgi:D-alanyl-D-alanine carboxypeptidase (penicillin-binding protein 5/6)